MPTIMAMRGTLSYILLADFPNLLLSASMLKKKT